MPSNATIYSLVDTPVDVDLVEKLAPDATVTSDDDATLVQWPDVTVRIERLADEQRGQHLQDMIGFIGQQSGGDTTDLETVFETVQSVQQVFGFVVEPEFDPGHKAKSLILSMTTTMEQAFTFANGMFYDPLGRVWLGNPDAGPLLALEDARVIKVPAPDNASSSQQARTTRILAVMQDYGVPCYQGSIRWIPDEASAALRTPTEVARRIVALHSTVSYGRGRPKEDVLADIARFGVDDELSPSERAFLTAEALDEDVRQQMVWRLEALVPLMWALGHIDAIGWPDTMVDVDSLHELIFEKLPSPEAVASAQLRPLSDILDALETTVRQHNGLRGCYTSGDPVPMNFNWNAPTDTTPAAQSLAAPLLAERHQALNWLIGYDGAAWDDVDTPT